MLDQVIDDIVNTGLQQVVSIPVLQPLGHRVGGLSEGTVEMTGFAAEQE